MMNEGYGDARTIERRIAKMEAWLQDQPLLEADPNAKYVYLSSAMYITGMYF